MAEPTGDPFGPTGMPTGGERISWDEALARLEDFLLSYPEDRALPGLTTLLRRARVPADFVRSDERALKVLHDAIVDRPFGTMDAVARARMEIELLTLEVEVLTDRLRDPAAGPAEVERACERLAAVRRELARIRQRL